jgi:hypothetical protein
MFLERTAAYVLAVACVLQTLHPSWATKPHRWRSIDVQIGRLRVQARNNAGSVCFEELAPAQRMPLLHSWQKEPKKLRICINDSSCMTAWVDGTTHAWLISEGKI